MHQFTFSAIGTIHSCYKEKFAIPRQPRLENEAITELVLLAPYNRPDALREIEQFSHILLIFIFNQIQQKAWKPLVRPPRLGGNQRIGVFASRSTFRPNPIGLSAVELVKINPNADKVSLLLRGCDLVDGTPIIDIKPYIPYSDAILNADAGFAATPPAIRCKVNFTSEAIEQYLQLEANLNRQKDLPPVNLKKLIIEILQLDPRPSYQQLSTDRVYAMRLYNIDLRWKYHSNEEILVLELANTENIN